MLTDDDIRSAWAEVRVQGERLLRRRRRQWTAGTALGVALVIVGSVTALVRSTHGGRPTHVATSAAQADPRQVGGGPVPSLEPLLELPPCKAGPTPLRQFILDSAGPDLGMSPSSEQYETITMADAATYVPVPRTVPPGASCALVGKVNTVRAWEVRDSAGRALGRGAGDVAVPRSRLHDGDPAQVRSIFPTGQTFTGVVHGTGLDGMADGVEVMGSTVWLVIETPWLAPLPLVAGNDGLARHILSNLSYSTVKALPSPQDAFLQPTRVPNGYQRCTTNEYGRLLGEPLGGTATVYCDRAGRSLLYRTSVGEALPSISAPVDIRGLSGRVAERPGLTQVAVVVSPPGTSPLTLSVEAVPTSATTPQLVDVLASVGFTDPAVYRPRVGTHDLRAQLSAQWLAAALTAAGAQSLERRFDLTVPCDPPTEICLPVSPEGNPPDPTAESNYRALRPDDPTIAFEFVLVGGAAGGVIVSPMADGGALTYDFPTAVMQLQTVDLHVQTSFLSLSSPTRVGAGCGRVQWIFIGSNRDIIDFASHVLSVLDC